MRSTRVDITAAMFAGSGILMKVVWLLLLVVVWVAAAGFELAACI